MRIHTLSWCNPLSGSFISRSILRKKPSELLSTSFKGMLFFGIRILKKQRTRDGKSKIRIWTKLKKVTYKLFLPGTYKQKHHLRLSSLSQGSLGAKESIHCLEQHHIGSEIVKKQMKFIKTLSEPLIWISLP